MRKLYKILFVLTMLCGISYNSMAQEADEKTCPEPVSDSWATSIIVDHQTVYSPWKGTFEFIIHHRFGEIESIKDLFGIYAPSNIRMGINYGITDRIMVGFGTEKNNKIQQFQAKCAVLRQSVDNKIPVSVSLYGNIGIATVDEFFYGNDYQFPHRLSYFGQMIISRKFTDRISVQVAPSYSHFNIVESAEYGPTQKMLVPVWQHDKVAVMGGARVKFYREFSLLLEYTQPLSINEIREYQKEPEPGFSVGLESNTATHCFQVFASNYDKIIPQHNINYTTKEISDLMFGFNITARF